MKISGRIGIAALAAAAAATGALWWTTTRRVERVDAALRAAEERVRRLEARPRTPSVTITPAPAGGAPAAAAPAAGPLSHDDVIRAHPDYRDPVSPEARAFVEEAGVSPYQWSMLTKLNRGWLDALEQAQRDGEASLPQPLEYVAEQNARKLRGIFPDGAQRAVYERFVGGLAEGRIRVRARSGKYYEGVPFE